MLILNLICCFGIFDFLQLSSHAIVQPLLSCTSTINCISSNLQLANKLKFKIKMENLHELTRLRIGYVSIICGCVTNVECILD